MHQVYMLLHMSCIHLWCSALGTRFTIKWLYIHQNKLLVGDASSVLKSFQGQLYSELTTVGANLLPLSFMYMHSVIQSLICSYRHTCCLLSYALWPMFRKAMKSLYEDSRSKSSCLESFSSSSRLAGILCNLLIQFFIFTLPEKSAGNCAICIKHSMGEKGPKGPFMWESSWQPCSRVHWKKQ